MQKDQEKEGDGLDEVLALAIKDKMGQGLARVVQEPGRCMKK